MWLSYLGGSTGMHTPSQTAHWGSSPKVPRAVSVPPPSLKLDWNEYRKIDVIQEKLVCFEFNCCFLLWLATWKAELNTWIMPYILPRHQQSMNQCGIMISVWLRAESPRFKSPLGFEVYLSISLPIRLASYTELLQICMDWFPLLCHPMLLGGRAGPKHNS